MRTRLTLLDFTFGLHDCFLYYPYYYFQVGYVEKGSLVKIQICQGQPAPKDIRMINQMLRLMLIVCKLCSWLRQRIKLCNLTQLWRLIKFVCKQRSKLCNSGLAFLT